MDFQTFSSLLPLYLATFGLVAIFIPLIAISWLISGARNGMRLALVVYVLRAVMRHGVRV